MAEACVCVLRKVFVSLCVSCSHLSNSTNCEASQLGHGRAPIYYLEPFCALIRRHTSGATEDSRPHAPELRSLSLSFGHFNSKPCAEEIRGVGGWARRRVKVE